MLSSLSTEHAARCGSAVGILLAAATASLGILLVSASAGAATFRDRTTADMPDDISGPQVHFLYVVPSDGADGQLDTNGAMEQSVARIQQWVVTQAGNQQALRVDTYKGVPDITFVRLPRSDAQATATYPWPIWAMGEDLVAAGFNDPAKVYAALYDGHSTWACGGAKSPALPKLGAMYIQGWPTNDPRPCRDAPGFGTGTDRPGFFEIGLLHEVLHTIGFAPSCAPRVTAPDHVDDSPTDLMYHPSEKSPAGWNWSRAVLDVNHDDHYRAHIPGCPDLSDSPYLMPLHSLSVTASGPGNVTSAPAGIDCPATCTSRFTGQVTLTATPSSGAAFDGWAGACSGRESRCTPTPSGDGAVVAQFSAVAHRRALTFRVRAHRATGALRVIDGYKPCGMSVPAIIERRGTRGWSSIRRMRTDSAGAFTASIPIGRAAYRARAPARTVNGQMCIEARSRTVSTSG